MSRYNKVANLIIGFYCLVVTMLFGIGFVFKELINLADLTVLYGNLLYTFLSAILIPSDTPVKKLIVTLSSPWMIYISWRVFVYDLYFEIDNPMIGYPFAVGIIIYVALLLHLIKNLILKFWRKTKKRS